MIRPILKSLNSDYSIGVVTYVRRFDTFFKPLVEQLEKYFPDVEKNYVLNGHYDTPAQEKYLKDAKEFLAGKSTHSVKAYMENQPLSRCMNQLILNSKAKKILIMNDDITVGPLFRPFLEAQIWRYPFFVINKSWCHFVISKDIVKKVGWFEERLPANGHEDGDYALRMGLLSGKSVIPDQSSPKVYCLGIKNIVADNEDPGWSKYSATVAGKYATANDEFFYKKWEISKQPLPQSVSVANEIWCRIRPGMETPNFYPEVTF